MSSTVFFFVAAACNENLGMRETSQVATTPRAFAGAGAFDEAIGGWDDASKTMDTKVSVVRKDIGGWYTSSLTHAEVIYDVQTFDEAIGGSDRSKMADRSCAFTMAYALVKRGRHRRVARRDEADLVVGERVDTRDALGPGRRTSAAGGVCGPRPLLGDDTRAHAPRRIHVLCSATTRAPIPHANLSRLLPLLAESGIVGMFCLAPDVDLLREVEAADDVDERVQRRELRAGLEARVRPRFEAGAVVDLLLEGLEEGLGQIRHLAEKVPERGGELAEDDVGAEWDVELARERPGHVDGDDARVLVVLGVDGAEPVQERERGDVEPQVGDDGGARDDDEAGVVGRVELAAGHDVNLREERVVVQSTNLV